MLVAMVVVEILVLRHLQSFKLCVMMLSLKFQVIPLLFENFAHFFIFLFRYLGIT